MYTNPFSKFLLSSFFSSPTRSFLLPKSSSFCFLWCGLASIGFPVLWLYGPLALCLFLQVYVLPFGLSAWSWVLVFLVGGVEWCYPCWDPARMFNELCEQGLSFCILLSLFLLVMPR
jgi:hypothetical protein